jgi:hypothetical protein
MRLGGPQTHGLLAGVRVIQLSVICLQLRRMSFRRGLGREALVLYLRLESRHPMSRTPWPRLRPGT